MPKLSEFRITKRTVDALGTDRDAIYFDADLRGFAIRTKPSGSKTYLVQYQNDGGRTRRVSFGQHGALAPAEARQKAAVLLGRAKAGEDPAQDRDQARKAMTVRQLCEAYLTATEKRLVLGKRGLPKKTSTLLTDRGRIERHIIPLLGNRKVRDLSTPEINVSCAILRQARRPRTSEPGHAVAQLCEAGMAPRPVRSGFWEECYLLLSLRELSQAIRPVACDAPRTSASLCVFPLMTMLRLGQQ
jgi:Arm DNA-binding domain